MNHKKYRLALDMGTNSIGWAMYGLNAQHEPDSLADCGVRIFHDGRDDKSQTSLKADRRMARQARRRRDRFLHRQRALLNALIELGLMPRDEAQRKLLAAEKNPWLIRRSALDGSVHPYELGRALFHLNQRRGFKSNRLTQDKETGPVNKSIADFKQMLEEAGARTVGEFCANRKFTADGKERAETVRARRQGSKKTDLYDFYPDRAMIADEFDRLWAAQKGFHPERCTEAAGQRLKDIIFHQRPLKPQTPGKCRFLPEEPRVAKALPSFQRFRIYQELANLRWLGRDGRDTKITAHLRDALADKLEKQKKLTFDAMRGIMKKMKIVHHDVRFNLEDDRRKHLDGNLTSCAMRARPAKNRRGGIGKLWDQLDYQRQDALIALLLDGEKDDEQVAQALREDFNIPTDKIEACLNIKLPTGYGALSLVAIERILPKLQLQSGLNYDEAVRAAGLGEANRYDPNARLQDRLEYYGKALEGHVLGGTGEEGDGRSANIRDERQYGIIPNPTVHIALNQLRRVVNELLRRYGKPYQIVIEIGRDLPRGVKGKAELKRRQKEGQENNRRIREELKAVGIDNASRKDVQKYQLWEELGKDPTDRRCIFSGWPIGLTQLVSAEVEVEHLLPRADTLDDSMANKTVCFRQANRDKCKQPPHAAFGDSPLVYNWEAIMQRVANLPKNKHWRFQHDAMQRFDEIGGFLARQLNDTRYISRYTRQYLATIVPQKQIWVVTGRLTAQLRYCLGLHKVLHDKNRQGDDSKPSKKNRDDHRHHAVDAIVVGLISRSMLQRVSTAVRASKNTDMAALFAADSIAWSHFRRDVIKRD